MRKCDRLLRVRIPAPLLERAVKTAESEDVPLSVFVRRQVMLGTQGQRPAKDTDGDDRPEAA